MLNDVKAPPLEMGNDGLSGAKPQAAGRAGNGTPGGSAPLDRAHQLDRETGRHSSGIDMVYADMESRGDSFNTILSAVVVASVVIAIGIIAAAMLL